MRPVVLSVLLLSASVALAAPAPFPKADRLPRESEQSKQAHLLYECRRRLDELGVTWALEQGAVTYLVRRPGGGRGGSYSVQRGDVAGTLREVVASVEEYLGLAPSQKP